MYQIEIIMKYNDKMIKQKQTIKKTTNIQSKNQGEETVQESSPYQHIECPEVDFELIELETQIYENVDLLPQQQYRTDTPFIIWDYQLKRDTEILITNYRIIIQRKQNKCIPLGYIQSLSINENTLTIYLKTGIHVEIGSSKNMKQIQACIQQSLCGLPFCLNSSSTNQQASIYDSWAEIDRMGVDWNSYSIVKNNDSVCAQYPHHFLIPKNFSLDTLQEIKKCRNDGKIPVMSFYYEAKGTGIWRAATKKLGLKKERQIFDYSYLKSISNDLVTFNFDETQVNLQKYSFSSLTMLKTKFHSFTSKYYKMLDSHNTSKSSIFLKSLSEWFQENDKLIGLAYHIVHLLKNGKHVLLEEENGSDRVAQIMALCQIIIDPFFRTFKGFSILIQKQFICFRHQFETRHGFNKNKSEDTAPIFIQFLECVHQLVVTHPQLFEYSSSYLGRIGYQLYTTKYKNFQIFPTQDDKKQKLKYCPRNIWDDINRELCHQNYHFNPKAGLKRTLDDIRKKPSIKQFSIWVNYYDLICKLNGQKKRKGSSIIRSKTLSIYLSKNRQT